MRSQRVRSGRGRVVVCGVVAMLAASVTAGLAGCVDGVTPDCSDAATHCGPDVDGSPDSNEAAPLPEAAPRVDGAAADAQGNDADAADLDAGDGG